MMRPRSMAAALVLGLSAVQVASYADAPSRASSPGCPEDKKLARLVSASDAILIGTMDVPQERLLKEAQSPSPRYVDIPLRVTDVAKGDRVVDATLSFFPTNAPDRSTNDDILGLEDAPAILFLLRVDDGKGGLYLTGNSPAALRPATQQIISAARTEVSRQAAINRSLRADTALPHHTKVRALISRLGRVSGSEQQRAFDRLIALGHKAVPAIVAQMDDRRPLRTQAISLVNRAPDAFEGLRHYGPEQIVDGLDAVLNQITGAGGSIVNGGSARQREATVAGWRVYASDLACGTPPQS